MVFGLQFHASENAPAFSLPEGFLDLKVPLPTAWDHHAEHSPDHALFVYEDGPDDIRTVTWRQGNRATHRAANLVQSFAQQHGSSIQDPTKPPVVGILAVKDSMTYWAMLTGIIRAGYVAFVISPRNSAAAVTHLLKVTGCSIVFVSGDSAMQSLSQEALENMERPAAVAPIPSFSELYSEDETGFQRLPPFQIPSMEATGMICHSSGSTSFPKPIRISHMNMCYAGLLPYSSDARRPELTGKVGSGHGLPLFHVIGASYAIIWTTSTGITLSLLKPAEPPIQATPEVVLENMLATHCEQMLVVPSFIEAWARDPKALVALKSIPNLKLQWGGGPLSQEAGDIMIENGININILYGTTEVLLVQKYNSSFPGKDWQYFEASPFTDLYFEPYGDGFHKLVVVSSSKFVPNVINYEVNGKPAYDTNDLLVEHPTKKGWWKIYGRADDQIMHSTGEKTNPGPLEHIINKHPSVQGCLMFGRGEFQTGIIIEPTAEKMFDPQDLTKLADFRNEIWPVVEEANRFAPQHSKIFKEMIITAYPDRLLMTTDKRTIKRQPNLNAYEEEIKVAYAALANSARQDVPFPTSWDIESVTNFVRELTTKVMEKSVNDTDDIFQRGSDSLQATSIRNSISRALRDSNKDTSELGQNLVYAHPTIASLSSFVYQIASGKMENGASSVTVEMEAMAKEFTQNFPVHIPSKPVPESEVILVTGTTGSMGTYIVDKLISMPSISRVYALNRPDKLGKSTLYVRQKKAFEEQGVDISVLSSPKLVLLEGDTASPDLGLPKEILEELVNSVTSIIHNAWRVDFNLALSSFKPLIRGVRNLVDLSLSSPFPKPPPVVFVSSVATLFGWSEPKAVPEHVLSDPRIAAGAGYGESKWVSEQILMKANEMTPSRNVVVRLGQVCGNTRNGNWNVWEWFPALVQSSKIVHCLPEAKGVVTWVPTDAAAAAVVDMRLSNWPFMHLVHPNPVQWSSMITPIAKALDVPLVPLAKWIERLQQVLEESANSGTAVQAAAESPALRLVDFYVGAANAAAANAGGTDDGLELEAFVTTRLATKETVKVSKTMAELPMLGNEDVERWLGYWKKKGSL